MSEFRTSVFSNKTQETYQPEKEVNTSPKFNLDLRPIVSSRWVRTALILLLLSLAVNLVFFNSPLEPQPKVINVRAP